MSHETALHEVLQRGVAGRATQFRETWRRATSLTARRASAALRSTPRSVTGRRARIGERAPSDGDELPLVRPDAERELQDPVRHAPDLAVGDRGPELIKRSSPRSRHELADTLC